MTDRVIDAECNTVQQPESWEDVPRYLAEVDERNFEADYEVHERLMNPNALALRDMLKVFASDTESLLDRITALFPVYVREDGMKPEKARRYFEYATRGLISPEMVTRAIDTAILFSKIPNLENHFVQITDPERRRSQLEQFVKYRNSLEPLRLDVDELDRIINGGEGVGIGEVLHLVGGEGGQKTSVGLHALTDFAKRGGKALFLSLDMHPRDIEVRLLMRLLNCGKHVAYRHIEEQSSEYRQAVEARQEIDANLRIMGGPLTLPQIEMAILASKADVIGIDYLTCVKGFKDELTCARTVSGKVREWRDRWGITFLLLSQMSRTSRQDQLKGGSIGHAIGGSSLEQLVDYELELFSDAPLIPGGHPRLIATLRKNRNGPSGRSFELFPFFPSIDISTKAAPVEHTHRRKQIFSNLTEW